jgi:hypothetical protein
MANAAARGERAPRRDECDAIDAALVVRDESRARVITRRN